MMAFVSPAFMSPVMANFSNPFEDFEEATIPVSNVKSTPAQKYTAKKKATAKKSSKKRVATKAQQQYAPQGYTNVVTTVRPSNQTTAMTTEGAVAKTTDRARILEDIEAIFSAPSTPVAIERPVVIQPKAIAPTVTEKLPDLSPAQQRKLIMEQARQAAEQAKQEAKAKKLAVKDLERELRRQALEEARLAEEARLQAEAEAAAEAERQRLAAIELRKQEKLRKQQEELARLKAIQDAKEAEKAMLVAQAKAKIEAELAEKARLETEARLKAEAEAKAKAAEQARMLAEAKARDEAEQARLSAATKIQLPKGKSLTLGAVPSPAAPSVPTTSMTMETGTYGSRATQSALQRATSKLAVDPAKMPLRNRVLGYTASEAQVKALEERYKYDPHKVTIVPKQVGGVVLLPFARLTGDSITIFKNSVDKRLVEEYLSYSPLHAQIFSNYVKRVITLQDGRTGSYNDAMTVDAALMDEMAYSFVTLNIPSSKLSEAQDKYLYIVSRLNEADQVKFWNWVNTVKIGDEINVPAWVRLSDALYSN